MTELELNELEPGDFVISPMGGVIEVRSVATKTPKYGARFKEVRLRNVPAALTAKNPLLSRYQSCKALKARAMAAADWINEHTTALVNDTSRVATADNPDGIRHPGRWYCSDGPSRDHTALIRWAESLGYGREADRG